MKLKPLILFLYIKNNIVWLFDERLLLYFWNSIRLARLIWNLANSGLEPGRVE